MASTSSGLDSIDTSQNEGKGKHQYLYVHHLRIYKEADSNNRTPMC